MNSGRMKVLKFTCMLAVGGTERQFVYATKALHEAGANEVYACFTHAVLSGNAVENISTSHLKKVIVTNTIPVLENGKPLLDGGKIEILSVGKLLSSAIKSIHDETSVSSLFI